LAHWRRAPDAAGQLIQPAASGAGQANQASQATGPVTVTSVPYVMYGQMYSAGSY
jgi:hypothetical protein